MKDLADVLEVIKLLNLPREMAGQLAEFAREQYLELWQVVRDEPAPHDQD